VFIRPPEQTLSDQSPDAVLPPLTSGELSSLAETFRLLGDPTRLRILMFCLGEPKPVGAIAEALELSQTLVSHHLRLLRAARLVRGERASRQIFYEVADHHVSHVLLDMLNHINEDAASS
jgi:DNA-binding transcriptional ArsR family regulator